MEAGCLIRADHPKLYFNFTKDKNSQIETFTSIQKFVNLKRGVNLKNSFLNRDFSLFYIKKYLHITHII